MRHPNCSSKRKPISEASKKAHERRIRYQNWKRATLRGAPNSFFLKRGSLLSSGEIDLLRATSTNQGGDAYT